LLRNSYLVYEVLGGNLNYLTEQERTLFELIDKVNRDSTRITSVDVQKAVTTGWSEEAVFTAITVCSLFNFYNRWCDGNGVHPLTPDGYVNSGHRLATQGYKHPVPEQKVTSVGY
jgi:hypothetical protein